MPRPRQLTSTEVYWVRTSGLSVARMARELGFSETPVRECMYGRTYRDHPAPPRELPEKPAFFQQNTRPDNAEILRRHEQDGKRPVDIARDLGVSRGCIVSAIRRAKDARAQRQPSKPAPAVKPAAPKATKPRSDNRVATDSKSVQSAKAKGGRTTAKNAYYRIHGGNARQHDASRVKARNTDPHACGACQSAPAEHNGLCGDCAGMVQRVKPAAAYGGEAGNLSRASSGLEADNIITAEPEAA